MFLEVYTFPLTYNTSEPISSTTTLDPTSKVCVGATPGGMPIPVEVVFSTILSNVFFHVGRPVAPSTVSTSPVAPGERVVI